MSDYLIRPEAAKYCAEKGLPTSKSTLQKLASTGGGPIYHRFGNRAVYTPKDLDDWISKKLGAPLRSASEPV